MNVEGDKMTVMQRRWYLTVRDHGAAGLLAEANYADTLTDRSLILEIELKTLEIKSAVLEVHRGQPGTAAVTPVTKLVGIPAYFGSGKKLRQALAETPVLLEMASQAISAVIQSEAFFYHKRGFSSDEIYEIWDKNFQNSCVYHSNLDRLQQRFWEYIEDQQRGSSLFHRHQFTSLDIEEEKLEVRSHLHDSYQEISLVLQLDQGLLIQKAAGTMLRCPDPLCREALRRIDSLKGTPLVAAGLKHYQTTCGGTSGCTHISHLVLEAAITLDIYKSNCACR